MAKQSIFGRITQLARANINAMIDSAEDPQKMMDQMIRDYRDNITDAEKAIAQTIGNLRLLQDDYRVNVAAAESWSQKAIAASNKAEESRTCGDANAAQKFDDLAKVAIQRQIKAENESQTLAPNIQTQEEVVEKLKSGLNQMKAKLQELRGKRDQLVARAKTVQAQNQIHDAVKAIDITDPNSEVARFEEKIRHEEARMLGAQELAASSLENQFVTLDELGEKAEVEARLAVLKSQHNVRPAALEGSVSEVDTAKIDEDDFSAEKELRVSYDITEEPES